MSSVSERLNLSGAGGRTTLGLAAGAAFIGYCVYFDYKRRHAPDFKKKLRERRLREREDASKPKKAGGGKDWMPNPNNQSEMQAYFLQEVQLGEELLSEGHVAEGLEHLSNAIAHCGQPQHLMQIFQSTLPPEIFEQLSGMIPDAIQRRNRVWKGMQAGGGTATDSGPVVTTLDDDDLDLE